MNRNTNATVTFSEPVTGVNNSTVRLTFQSGFLGLTQTTVPAVVIYDPATRIATINPNATLASNTTYTIRFTTGSIRDAQNAGVGHHHVDVQNRDGSVT